VPQGELSLDPRSVDLPADITEDSHGWVY
jgi:hypothetical protein